MLEKHKGVSETNFNSGKFSSYVENGAFTNFNAVCLYKTSTNSTPWAVTLAK